MYREWKEIEFPKHMNLGTTRLRGRPRNRWQDEVRQDGRTVDQEGWQENEHNREERKKLLRTARNHHIPHMPMELINVSPATLKSFRLRGAYVEKEKNEMEIKMMNFKDSAVFIFPCSI